MITGCKTYSQPAITCSKLTIDTLEQGVNMFKVNNKDPLLFTLNIFHTLLVDSGKTSPRRFFRWFWDFLKENFFVPVFFLLKSFILNCFSKCNHYFQSVLISWVLIAENITKMSHTQQWFYWNSTFQSWILLKLHCLHN